MAQVNKNYISYASLRAQRLLLGALVLGLLVVVVGILFEVYYRGAQATKISPAIRVLAEPLNPVLNTEVLAQLEGYEQLSLDLIKSDFALQPPSQIVSSAQGQTSATESAQPDLVQQSIEDNTLSEEETLSDEELNSLLEEPALPATQGAQL